MEQVRAFVLGDGPYDAEQLGHARRMMSKRIGFHFEPHDLRRTFSRQLEMAEVPMEVISGLMGHSLGMTGHYTAGVGLRRMERGLAALDYLEGRTLPSFWKRRRTGGEVL